MNEVRPPAKPGIRTTEFWVTIVTVLGALLLPFLPVEKAERLGEWATLIGQIAAAAAAVAYAFARAIVKRA